MWLVFFIISIGCLCLIPVVMHVVDRFSLIKNYRFKLLTGLFVGVLASSVFIFFPMHVTDTSVTSMNGIRAVFLSIFNSVQLFTAGCEFAVVKEGLANCPENLSAAYQVWSSALFVIAPVLTFGFVLSLFKKLSAHLKYSLSFFKDVYVFSELNEKSIILANDIKNSNKNAAIVFTDVFEENEETSYELVEEAKKLRAICFKSDILVVNFAKHSAKKPITFFAIGEDETENLNQSLKIIEKYKALEKVEIYVFSTKIESGILLSSADIGKMKVRRINEAQLLINHLLYGEGRIIFQTDKPKSNEAKDISVIVVGMGRHGTEMVKSLSWYGQMDGYNLEINAYDKDPLAEEKFVALAPELMSVKHNGTHVEGDAQYKITIHSGIDTDTITFANEIQKITNATYVLVALGDDDVNIRTAINLRMYFERMKIQPAIRAIVYNSQQKKALDGIKNFAGQSYDIEFKGDWESTYIRNVIMDSKLETEARELHEHYVEGIRTDDARYEKVLGCYLKDKDISSKEELKAQCLEKVGNEASKKLSERDLFYPILKEYEEEKFRKYEYNYRSSIATAVHNEAKRVCGVLGTDSKKELTKEEVERIQILEKRRWNAYTRAEGYIYSGSRDYSSRNDLAKMHHCLVEYDKLTEDEKKRNSEVVIKKGKIE